MKKQIIIFLAVLSLASSAFGMAIPEAQPKGAYRFMTYNIRRDGKEAKPDRIWSNRAALVAGIITAANPDVIGIQEATENQITDLHAQLKNYASERKGRGAAWHIGQWLGFKKSENEFNPIFWNQDKFELVESETFSINQSWFYGPNVKKTGWHNRICTRVKLKDKATDKEFFVYNTHLDNSFPEARAAQVQVIKEHIAQNTGDMPVIVTGDFNAQFDGEIKTAFDGFDHAKEVATKTAGPKETRTGWGDDELKPIDHILLKAGKGIVLQHVVVNHPTDAAVYPSDHRAVYVDITLN
jgi:endonuclease/exonuclease/phosphatase family metal-dependent hydrolase